MRLAWLQQFLNPDRRREERRGLPGIVAYYWDGSSSRAHDLLDISMGGSYMLTEDRWYPDTILKVTLRCTSGRSDDPSAVKAEDAQTICVLARVARSGTDGVGLQFVFPGEGELALDSRYPECASNRRELKCFLERVEGQHGDIALATT